MACVCAGIRAWVDPEKFQEMFGKNLDFFRKKSGNVPLLFSENKKQSWTVTSRCPSPSSYGPPPPRPPPYPQPLPQQKISRIFPEMFRKLSGIVSGIFPEIFPEHVRKHSGNFPNNFPRQPANSIRGLRHKFHSWCHLLGELDFRFQTSESDSGDEDLHRLRIWDPWCSNPAANYYQIEISCNVILVLI